MELPENIKLKLLTDYRSLIKASVVRYCNIPHLYDDLISEGVAELLEAMKDYQPERRVHIARYFQVRLKTYYRNRYKYLKRRSFVDIDDITEPVYEPFVRAEDEMFLKEAMNELTETERKIIELYYLEQVSIKEIARRMNMTDRHAYYLKTKALNKIQKYAGQKNIIQREGKDETALH